VMRRSGGRRDLADDLARRRHRGAVPIRSESTLGAVVKGRRPGNRHACPPKTRCKSTRNATSKLDRSLHLPPTGP
jgi:hypothetical protein